MTLRLVQEEIVRLKATLLEMQEQMLIQPLKNDKAMNKYAVQQMGSPLNTGRGSKLIRFIGVQHMLANIYVTNGPQQGKTLTLVKLPSKEYESIETIPKNKINIKSNHACGNDHYLMDCRNKNTLVFYDI